MIYKNNGDIFRDRTVTIGLLDNKLKIVVARKNAIRENSGHQYFNN